MRYNIESVIKRLQEAQRKGKDIIDEAELINIATPQINDIDKTLYYLERGIQKLNERNKRRGAYRFGDWDVSEYTSFTEAENFTGIPRRTFYRWKDEGILQCHPSYRSPGRPPFSLQELKDIILKIKQTKKV